jgi:hypothetical protein
MKNPLLITLILLLWLTVAHAEAGTFRVHYSMRGSGRDVTVQAESSAEARRTVMDMFPGAVVTGVHQIRKQPSKQHEHNNYKSRISHQ